MVVKMNGPAAASDARIPWCCVFVGVLNGSLNYTARLGAVMQQILIASVQALKRCKLLWRI